jgi:hypothetical protein
VCAQSRHSPLRQTTGTHSLTLPAVSPRRGFPTAYLLTDAHIIMPPTVVTPTVCPRLCSSSPPARDRPPWFFTSPAVHAATAMCAARLLLPTLRPVSFSPLRCAIRFPSPSRLCIAHSSPAASLLLVCDIKVHCAGHRNSRPCISGLTSPSSALALSCRPPSRPHKKSPKQSRRCSP